MGPQKLMELLQKAAQEKNQCTLAQIREKLVNEAFCLNGEIVGELFDQTITNRPATLPELYPAFALLCGDRLYGEPLAGIDWAVYPQQIDHRSLYPLQEDWPTL